MKKIGGWIILAVIVLFSFIRVDALTSSELKEKLLDTVSIGENTYTLTDSQKVIVERYFNQNAISDSDATYIGERVDSAIRIIKNQGNVDFQNYPQSVKNELKNLVLEINNNTNVKATLTKDGLSLKNFDGSIVIINGPVKRTGYETSSEAFLVLLSFVIVITVSSIAFVKKIRENV